MNYRFFKLQASPRLLLCLAALVSFVLTGFTQPLKSGDFVRSTAASGTVSVSGGAFQVVSGGNFSLSDGAAQNVRIRFTPPSANSSAGTATVNGSANVANPSVSLSGTGKSPPPVTYTVTPSAGANGSINPSTLQTVNSGGNVTFTATPFSGYVVDQWLVLNTGSQFVKEVRRRNLSSYPFFILYGVSGDLLVFRSLIPSASDPLTWLGRFAEE